MSQFRSERKELSFDDAMAKRLESLKERSRKAQEILIRKKTEYEAISKNLKEDIQNAEENFGTSDLNSLKKIEEDMKNDVIKRVDDFEKEVEQVEKLIEDNIGE